MDVGTLADLHIFSLPEYEKKKVAGMRSIFLYVRMDGWLPGRFNELHSYSVFESSSVRGRSLVNVQ
jgi:hypothetical protein